jgi:hypothetical protein
VLSSFAHLARDLRAPQRWCRRLLGAKEYPGELPQFAIVKQPAQHVRWDLKRALLIKLVARRKFKPIIEPVYRCCHEGADERRRLDNHGAGKATVRMTIVQPKERHILRCSARPGRSRERQAVILIIVVSWADRGAEVTEFGAPYTRPERQHRKV